MEINPWRMVRCSLSDQAANQILSVAKQMSSNEAGQFFVWLGQHLSENNFDSVNSPPDVRLRMWLQNSDTVAILILKYQLIMSKADEIGLRKR